MALETSAPTSSPTSTSTTIPTSVSTSLLTAVPSAFLLTDVPTNNIFDHETYQPCDETTAGNSTNATEMCASDSGAFFLEVSANNMVVDYVAFSYELETRGHPASVLTSLEYSFVDSLLPFLFPFECQHVSSLDRNLEAHDLVGIAGISSDPPDEIMEGGKYPQSKINRMSIAL